MEELSEVLFGGALCCCGGAWQCSMEELSGALSMSIAVLYGGVFRCLVEELELPFRLRALPSPAVNPSINKSFDNR